MKKIFGNVVSFMLGATLFIAGSAIADEPVIIETESVSDPAPPAVIEETPQEVVSEQPTSEPKRSSDNPVFCWNVGKTNELGQDCFCVEGSVTNMDEVDCLIESGIVGEDTREVYREWLASQN